MWVRRHRVILDGLSARRNWTAQHQAALKSENNEVADPVMHGRVGVNWSRPALVSRNINTRPSRATISVAVVY